MMPAISRARAVAVSSDSSSRPEKRCRRWPKSSVRASSVETSVSILAWRLAIEVFGAAVARFEQFDRLGERAAVRAELVGEVAEVVQHLGGDGVERAEMLFDLGGGRAALAGQIVHGGDEFGNARRHGVLDRAHVLLSAAEHFLQQDVGLAQALEQRGGVGAQHGVRLQHVGDGRRRGLFGFLDRGLGRPVQLLERARDRRLGGFGDALGAFLQLAERARHRGRRGQARVVDQAGDLLALVHHGLGEDEALGVDRLHRLIGDAADFAGELLALAGQGREQRFEFSSSRRVMSSTRCVMAVLISLALPTMLRETSVLMPTSLRSASLALRPIASLAAVALLVIVVLSAPALRLSETVASAALRLRASVAAVARRRALAERFGRIGGELGEGALGARRIGLDRFGELLQARIEQIGGGAAAHFHLMDDGFGAADQELLQMADPAVERIGDLKRAFAEGRVDLGDALADGVGELRAARMSMMR